MGNHNVEFMIFSMTGRILDSYSELGENQILFAPSTQFMVCNFVE